MPDVVVVPLDQSDVAERALPVAETLADQLDSRLHLVSVLPVVARRGEEYYKQNEPWRTSFQEIESYLGERSSAIETQPVSTEILMGLDAGLTIHESLKAMANPLLVISSHGRSGFRRMVLGSTAARITRVASYPLVVVPAGPEYRPDRVSRILVALDGSEFAENALRVTLDLFRDSSLSLHLVQILDPMLSTTDPYVHAKEQEAIQSEAHGYLDGLASDLAKRGIDTSSEVRQSQNVVDSLVEVAQQHSADLIAMATHGRTGIRRAIIGSVADGVLRSATEPLLLIRPRDEVAEFAPENGPESGATA